MAACWLALACSGASTAGDGNEGSGGTATFGGSNGAGGAKSLGGARVVGGAGATSVSAGGAQFVAMGGSSSLGPPPAQSNGDSPYLTECHGDTSMCRDVVNLRCLGLRDGSDIYGYSCSNECNTDADCSTAPSHVEASAGCVDFVTSRHCLLVCLQDGVSHGCPTGMACKSYPGAGIGYCLWP